MTITCPKCSTPAADNAKFCQTCGSMLEVAVEGGADPMLGKVLLGRYRVTGMIGEGGMGKVYLAEQKMGTATRKVAIKTLHPELGNDPQLVARFHRESETVIELSHPNTIQFYDFGELEDGTLFIVMEYIQGESLAHVLSRGPLDLARAEKVLIQICGSLHEAHQRGVVHRDLKPDNILLTARGGQTDFVKVLDFGIAKRSEAEDATTARLTKQGMVLGTPPYMSPEQFSGQALDARSDIYSLGIITYEMLTGHLPFQANTPWEWATQHLTVAPQRLDVYPSGAHVPPQKTAAIMRSLAKNRDHRHSTVLEYLQEFTGYHDAQAAWTMVTAAGGIVPRAEKSPSSTSGAHPYGHPGGSTSMPGTASLGPHSGATPSFGGPVATPTGNSAAYGSGTMEAAIRSGSRAGKILAFAVLGLFMLGGGLTAAIYVFTQNAKPERPNLADTEPARPVTKTSVIPSPPPATPIPIAKQVPTAGTLPSLTPENLQGSGGNREGSQRGAGSSRTKTRADRSEPPSKVSPQQESQARAAIAAGTQALRADNLESAIGALMTAQRTVGRSHPLLVSLRRDLERKGGNQVGNLLIRARCPDAQNLYRRLQAVGAERGARQQFAGADEWCRRP